MTVGDDYYAESYGDGSRPSGGARCCLLMLNLTSLIPLIVAIIHFGECSAISSLEWYLIVFGSLGTINAFVKFHFGISPNPSKQRKDCPSFFSNILGIGQLLVAIWGAIISWDKIPNMNNVDCEISLLTTTIVSSIICCFILLLVIIFGICACVRGFRNQNDSYY